MRAVILAGGKGTRLKPYTVVLPKPLVPVGDYPILEIVIRQLANFGFSHITMAVNHLSELVEAFFGNGDKWGIKIDYSLEDKPLSTMGPLKLIKDLPEDFLVMNGDILTDLDYSEFFRYHADKKNMFTISSFQRRIVSEYGVLETDSSGALTGFREKPSLTYDVSMGIYMVSRKILDRIPENTAYGFDNLMKDMINAGDRVDVRKFDGIWLDIGNPDDHAMATEIFEENKKILLY